MRRFLLLEDAVASAKTSELVPLLGAHALAAAVVDLGLADPVPQRLGRAAEITCDAGDRAARTDQAYRLPELSRYGERVLPPNADSFPGPWPKPKGVHESGGTPDLSTILL
jgi:hypothetical protein